MLSLGWAGGVSAPIRGMATWPSPARLAIWGSSGDYRPVLLCESNVCFAHRSGQARPRPATNERASTNRMLHHLRTLGLNCREKNARIEAGMPAGGFPEDVA